jgi:osmotically inducible protein OsmC
MKIIYSTQATSTGGREGSSKTADGVLAVTLTTPKEMEGDGAPAPTPSNYSPSDTPRAFWAH